MDTIVNGRVDYGIGHVIPYSCSDPPTCQSHSKWLFHTILLIVEAKATANLNYAMPQLVVYLASIHQSQLEKKQHDASVYGAASDGNSFIFVTITHEGVFKKSRQFEISSRELLTILGCLKYMLAMQVIRSPNVTSEVSDEEVEVHYDPDLAMAIDNDLSVVVE